MIVMLEWLVKCFLLSLLKDSSPSLNTVKPRYSAPAYNEFPLIKHANFGPKKHFHSYFYVGNSENLGLEYNFDQSLEIRYIGVQL